RSSSLRQLFKFNRTNNPAQNLRSVSVAFNMSDYNLLQSLVLFEKQHFVINLLTSVTFLIQNLHGPVRFYTSYSLICIKFLLFYDNGMCALSLPILNASFNNQRQVDFPRLLKFIS